MKNVNSNRDKEIGRKNSDLISTHETLNNLNDKYDTESVYTKNFDPFTIKLELLEKTNLRKIKNKTNHHVLPTDNNIKDDGETILIFKICYETSEHLEFPIPNASPKKEESVFNWEIYKSFENLKNFFTIVNLKFLYFNSDSDSDIPHDITSALKVLINLNIDEYKNVLNLITKLLNSLSNIPKIRDKIFFLEFLEISRHSFDCFNEGNKPKEGYILKRVGIRKHSLLTCLCAAFTYCCRSWQTRWFVLKDDMICYLDNSSSNIGKDVFWFDQELIVHKDFSGKSTLGLINGSRTLVLKFTEEYEKEIWYDLLMNKINAYQSNVKNLYDSFANEKNFCNSKWFVEAESYFSDLYEKLINARESIYIAGWWVSPELYLKRPVCLNKDNDQDTETSTRLMDVLKLKAEEGVMVHLLVYKEVKLALSVNSNHTKNIFNKLHPNIKVTRHPKNNLDLLWSHHEKIVIIDQRIGYIGGIDLCWGRYDTKDHLISEKVNDREVYQWPGIDYSNSRICDFINVQMSEIESVDRNQTQRMPWHDISVFLEGPVISDLCRHFVERWNFARTNSTFTRNKKYTITNVKRNIKRSYSKESYSSNVKTNLHVHGVTNLSTESNSNIRTPLIEEDENKVDGDYNEAYSSGEKNKRVYPSPKEINENSFESNQEFFSNEVIKIDDLKEINKRYTFVGSDFANKSGMRKSTKNSVNYNKRRSTTNIKNNNEINKENGRISLLKKIKGAFNNFRDKIKIKSNNVKEKIMTTFFKKNFDDILKDEDLIDIRINDGNLDMTENRTCQILRSAAQWSVGLDKKVENSILKAYYDIIDNSKHYILIENQFFLSKSFTKDESEITNSTSTSILNEIALHIRKRIERAFIEKKKFRVFIFIPLLPAFPGDVMDTTTLQIILKYTYRTISRNRGLSLIEKLYQLMGDGYEDYIHFFSLRTHGMVNNLPSTELIYIHSKIMIVDDEVALIGSANINDRSMLGYRDSEIAVIIKDKDKLPSKMDGEAYLASQFAHSLRVRLFKEHMGFDEDGVESEEFPEILLDPLDDKLFKIMKQIAKSNTEQYREIFNVYPDDKFKRFADIYESEMKSESGSGSGKSNKRNSDTGGVNNLVMKYNERKNKIIGNIVDFPLNFLKEENLNRSYFSREIIVPIKNFL